MLESNTANTNGDNPTWRQAMKGPFADDYWEAAGTKVKTLERIKAQEVVERFFNEFTVIYLGIQMQMIS